MVGYSNKDGVEFFDVYRPVNIIGCPGALRLGGKGGVAPTMRRRCVGEEVVVSKVGKVVVSR